MICIQLRYGFPGDVSYRLASGDCARQINLHRVGAGDMVHYDAEGTTIRNRCRGAPFRLRDPFDEGSQAGGAFLDAPSQLFSTTPGGASDLLICHSGRSNIFARLLVASRWNSSSLSPRVPFFSIRLRKVALWLVTRLRPGFVDDVEGRLRGAAEPGKSSRRHNLSDACLARLRPQAQTDLLRA